jgi:hypothetical protein
VIYRSALILITVFWVVMNVLLWRAEYGDRDRMSASVPAEVIWQKMLTAPDSSSLSIFHHGKKVGFCHWITSVGQELSKAKEEDAPPEGMVGRVSSYRIQIEGNLALPDSVNRARFDGVLRLATNRLWQDFNLRLNFRPVIWEIRSVAAEQTVHLKSIEGDAAFDRVFKFADLENPTALLQEFVGPWAPGVFDSLGLGAHSSKALSSSLGLKWEASRDSMDVRHASVRAYRLKARLLDRYQMVIFVSRVGEILRVELPDEIVLTNDQLFSF